MISCLVTMLVGTCAVYSENKSSEIHRILGAFTFIMCTVGLISGLLTSAFTNWAGYIIVGLVIAFILIYSIFIIWFTSKASIAKIKMRRALSNMSRGK